MALTRDFAIIQYDGTRVLQQSLALPYASGEKISGPLKITQWFMYELFTLEGSVRFRPDVGCSLVADLQHRNITSGDAIRSTLQASISYVVAKMQARVMNANNLPDSREIIDSVEILDMEQHLDRVVVRLEIFVMSSESVTIPVTFDL